MFTGDEDGHIFFKFAPPGSEFIGWQHEQEYPLRVWAYGGKPVTGDYDLWQLAPMRTAADILNDVETLKRVDVPGGQSVVNNFVLKFREDMNGKFGGHPRIQHGPEMFNLDFMQPLDPHLTVIGPGREMPTSFSLYDGASHEASQSLVDKITAWRELGYVFLENPRYREDPLKLGGEPVRGEDASSDRIVDFDNKLLASSFANAKRARAELLMPSMLGAKYTTYQHLKGKIRARQLNLEFSEAWLRNQSRNLDLPASQAASAEKQIPWMSSEALENEILATVPELNKSDIALAGKAVYLSDFPWSTERAAAAEYEDQD